MLHSPLLQLTKNKRHLGHLKLLFYYSTFITNNEVKNENRLSVFRSRQNTGREGTFILTFHTAFLVTGADSSHSFRMTLNIPPLWRLTAFPHYGNRSFAAAQDDVLLFPSLRRQIQILHQCTGWRLADHRHSERWQECLVGKTGNGTMNRSEESMSLMTSYRFSSLR